MSDSRAIVVRERNPGAMTRRHQSPTRSRGPMTSYSDILLPNMESEIVKEISRIATPSNIIKMGKTIYNTISPPKTDKSLTRLSATKEYTASGKEIRRPKIRSVTPLAKTTGLGGMATKITAQPSAYGTKLMAEHQNVRPTKTGAIISGCCMFGNVLSQASFGESIQQFELNPLNSGLFPLARPVAKLYEVYKCLRLRLIYASQTGTAATGALYSCVQYDPDNAVMPLTPREFMNHDTNNRETIWAPASVLNFDTRIANKMGFNGGWRYVGRGQNATQDSQKLISLGMLYVATTDYSSPGTILGDIMVEYSFEFSAQLPPNPKLDYEWIETHSTGTVTAPFTTFTVDTSSTILLTKLTNSLLRIDTTGEYMVNVWYAGTGLSAANTTWTPSGASEMANEATLSNGNNTVQYFRYKVTGIGYLTLVSTATTLTAVKISMSSFPFEAHTTATKQLCASDEEAIRLSSYITATSNSDEGIDDYDGCH